MKDKILLRMRYIHREYVEVTVDDPDRCTILDILVGLLEGAEKQGMSLPDQPTLWYAHNSQSFQVESDNDVVNMFNLFHDKMLINLAIGSSESSYTNLELARILIESKRPVESSRYIYGGKPTSNKRVPPTSARRRGIYVSQGGSTSDSLARQHTVGSDSVLSNDDLTSANVPAIALSVVDMPIADLPSTDETTFHDYILPQVDDEFWGDDSETDDYFDRLYDNGELCGENDFGKIKLKEWMLFIDKDHMMDVLRDYCMQEGFSVVVLKAEQRRYTAICGDSKCNWRVHASRLSDEVTWAIKTLNDTHTCLKLGMYNPMATPGWAARKILEYVRADDEIKGRTLQNHLFEKFGINMKTSSLYKARTLALKMIKGDDGTSYGSLPGYCEAIKISNPNSKAHIILRHGENDPEKPIQFKSVFNSLKPMIEGFIQGCRGLIGVDGCHLKGKYGGVVLSAVAMDGNNEIFPLAYGVYENESKATWSSFFYHLRELLRNANRNNWCIVSDRQKGVEPALGEVWPTASRRYCCTHLCANFKKAFPGKPMNDLFWSCCKAYSEFKFKKAMEMMEKKAGMGAIRWLQGLGNSECWARYKYDPNLHSHQTSSNFVESYNSTLGSDRCLPVLSLLEGIRRTIMARHCIRQEAAENMPLNSITEYAKQRLAKGDKESRSLQVFKASPTEYEVIDGHSSLAVNIMNRTCGCGEWQIRGIPCRHAVRTILEFRGHPAHYVSEWFSIQTYKRTYSVNYRPVPDEEQWPAFDVPRINPPPMKRKVGRPPRNRRRQEGQEAPRKRSRVVRCGRCKAFGHNVKTCKGGPTARELKEQQGIRVERRKRRKTKEANNEEQLQSVDIVMPSQLQAVDVVMPSAPWVPENQ